ncbi:MAG: J domain-containing protein [Patescibacteria group bacterium]
MIAVARSQYRVLQKIHHPDRGGSAKVSAKLNWAMEELEDPKRAASWRKKLLNSSKKNKLLEELEALRQEQEQWLQNHYLPQLKALCLNSQQVFIDILGIRSEPLWIRRYKPGPTLVWARMPAKTKKEKADRERVRQVDPVRNLVRLFVETDQLQTEDYKGVRSETKRLPLGVITSEAVQRQTGFRLNTVPRMMLEILENHQDPNQFRLPGEKVSDAEFLGGIPSEVFIPALPLVQPIRNKGFLISAEVSENQLRFHLEGDIVAPKMVADLFNRYNSGT